MTVHWTQVDGSLLPEEADWVGPDEKEVLAGIVLPKRRREWLLGRYAAKRLVGSFVESQGPDRLQIIAAKDGAPEPFVDQEPVEGSLSISHRDGVAACAYSPDGVVGCDLEAVEPRTARFVRDFFTERESALAEESPRAERDLRVALTWSAKESTLKVLRVGLRRDTRDVEVDLDVDDMDDGREWRPFQATVRPEQRLIHGWWCRRGNLVLTIASDAPTEAPPASIELPQSPPL